MADTSKFIFTDEGRTLLVSQTGGIKFAILGFMLVEGLAGGDTPSAKCEPSLKERWDDIELSAKEAKMTTLEYLIADQNVTFLMKGVNYTYQNEHLVVPTDKDKYDQCLQDYRHHLYGTYYVPSTELMADNGNRYGMYAFNFDRTYIDCEIPKDRAFQVRHIILIGKQYAENKEASFNVHPRQDVGIVGVAEIVQPTGAGIQILANQNDFVTFQCQLRFTVTPCDKWEDVTTIFIDDSEGKDVVEITESEEGTPEITYKYNTEIYEPVSDIASKLALVNNGLKTLSGGVTIGQSKEILDELQLGPDGAICMTKTLTVADCIDADDAENQFNAAALLHPINKYPEDGKEYVPQVLMTTVHSTSALNEDITAYSVGMTVKAEGKGEPYVINDGYEAGVDAPIFKLGHVPENDRIAVDIFGLDNKINGYVQDRFLFSTENSATIPSYNAPNIVIASDRNSFTNGASQNGTTLIYSHNNELTNGAAKSLFVGSHMNHLSGGADNELYGSHTNKFNGGSSNELIFSDNNYLVSNSNSFINSYVNSAVDNASNFTLYSSRDNILGGNSYNNTLFGVSNSTMSGTTTNSVLMSVNRTSAFEDTKAVAAFHIQDTILSGAYEDTLIGSRGSKMIKSYYNGYIDNTYCTTVSSEQNTILRSRYVGVKGLPIGSIDTNERPILSDVQSNNNIILGGEYFDLFSCSNNLIMDSYKLQSNDDSNSLGPVRIKGSTIINSSKSKLYNAREVHLLNSEYTRVNALSNYTDNTLSLPGTSLTMGSTNELDSIYYGEFYNGSDYYAYYGLKGSSYKPGAISLKTTGRPADLLKLKMMFINSFGSELNLAGYNPYDKTKKAVAYNEGASFKYQNNTLMNTSIMPQNTNVLGGHHNKIVGGKNAVILGGEYCKSSTYEHQILMGKFNRDVPADIIFGCGHFNGTSYTQGSKEYSEAELATIETMSGTIDGVRGDVGNNNGETCFNALEFYAHQGKLVLQNCDDGHDAGTNAISNNFGKSVSIDPTGIVFRDKTGSIIGEISIDNQTNNDKWTFIVDFNTDGEYYVVASVGTPSYIKSIDAVKLASYLFKYADMKTYGTTDSIMTASDIFDANSALFSKTIPAEINVVVRALKDDKTGSSTTESEWAHINMIYPWLSTNGSAPRYIPNGKTNLHYYYVGPDAATGNSHAMKVYLMPTLNSNSTCNVPESITKSVWNRENVIWKTDTRGSIPFVQFNDNKTFSEWIPDGFMGVSTTVADEAEYVTMDFLTNQTWTAANGTVANLAGFNKNDYVTTSTFNGAWSNPNATVGNADKVDNVHINATAGSTLYFKGGN